MGVIEITSKEDWAQKHAEAKNSQKPIIVDFSATWCGPCRLISPYFDELSTQYPGIIFLKVDVDAVDLLFECEEPDTQSAAQAVSTEAGISAMPTFQVWKDGEKVEELVGAAKEKLKEMIERHAAAPVAA